MSTYNDLLTFEAFQANPHFKKLVRIIRDVKTAKADRKSFIGIERALQELQNLPGFVGQSSSQETGGTFQKSATPATDWAINSTIFFFIKSGADNKKTDANDNSQWVSLICLRSDLKQRLGIIALRKLPMRLHFNHVRQRLLERSGNLLDLNSDPIIFAASMGPALAHMLTQIPGAPQQDGVYPFSIPQPLGMFLGYGRPCNSTEYDYAIAESYLWKRGAPTLPQPPKPAGLPGVTAPMQPTPTLPIIGTSRKALLPLAHGPDVMDAQIIKPTFKPTLELSVHTYIDMRMMLGAQRGLYNQQLHPLLSDKGFIEGVSTANALYMHGNMPISAQDQPIFSNIRYMDGVMRKIILSRQWADEARHALRSYIKPDGPT